jgi:hypothetical protein
MVNVLLFSNSKVYHITLRENKHDTMKEKEKERKNM